MAESLTTPVPGTRVGHYTDAEAGTGCTVILCEDGAVAGVDVRGSAPGTIETDTLRGPNVIGRVNAVLLSGGSAFGLAAASGVVRYLEEQGAGRQVGPFKVPIVPAAILFDLGLLSSDVRPGSDEGYAACQNATTDRIAEGSVGAATGATVGKTLGFERVVKGGLGSYSLDLGDGLVVGAVVAVNAIGSVFDADTGALVAGPRDENGAIADGFAPMVRPGYKGIFERRGANTTIGVVATNAPLTNGAANKLATVAHDGLAMAIRPAHTMGDGDTIFALATGVLDRPADLDRLGAAAAICVSTAIVRGVQAATGLGGVPSVGEL